MLTHDIFFFKITYLPSTPSIIYYDVIILRLYMCSTVNFGTCARIVLLLLCGGQWHAWASFDPLACIDRSYFDTFYSCVSILFYYRSIRAISIDTLVPGVCILVQT